MKHSRFDYAKRIVEADINLLLTGEAGTGKTTLAMQIAEELGLQFSCLSFSKQTSANAIIGFKSINGVYIPSMVRDAYENGHLLLLDEIDAGDPNVLLLLNTLENGFISFPDKIVHGHKDFRLVATSNPQGDHVRYSGRSKLDFATLDRYLVIELDRDNDLEVSLTSQETIDMVTVAREILKDRGSIHQVTMRDSIRIHKLLTTGIDSNPIKTVVFAKEKDLYSQFEKKVADRKKRWAEEQAERKRLEELEKQTQHECETFEQYTAKIAQGK